MLEYNTLQRYSVQRISHALCAILLTTVLFLVSVGTSLAAFSSGDRVQAIDDGGYAIRSSAGGSTVRGYTVNGYRGTVVSGPAYAWLNGVYYKWYNVNWDNGADGWSVSAAMAAVASVPGTPVSTAPGTTSSPGPILSSRTVTLDWSTVSGAEYYEVGVKDIATGSLVVDDQTQTSSYTTTLEAGREYRWNVAAGNSAGLSGYSTRLYFQTPSAVTVPDMPKGTSPGTTSSPGPVLSTRTVTLDWSSVSGATYYDLGVRDLATGDLVVDTQTTSSSRTVTLTAGRQYRWNVAAGNSAGLSSYTTPRFFQTPSDASPVLSVTPSSPPIQSSTASSLNLNVSNTGGGSMSYSASVTSGSTWLSITSDSSGGNSGAIVVSYMTNPSAQRSGTIQVTASGASGSPVTVTITQAGTGGGSSVPITQDFIPVGRNNRPAYPLIANFITIHDTDNSNVGANAVMHSNYLKNSDTGVNMPNNPLNPKSWHFTVDDGAIYQHLPTNENGWHAGDGEDGTGNRQSIGIEICMNGDGNRAQAEDNAAWLTAKLLKDMNLSIDRVKQHYDWSAKNCPSVLRSRVGGWDGFLSRVVSYMDQSSPSSYTVSYNPNGATSGTVPATQSKTQGETLALRTNSGKLAKTGYTFAGWNTAANGSGTDYSAGGTYVADASATLYVRWQLQRMSPTEQTLSTRRPEFSWSEIAGATFYQIWINRNGSTYVSGWVQGNTNWTPSEEMPAGSYHWWVRGWGSNIGLGAWSSAANFLIEKRTPGAIVQLSPSGAQQDTTLSYRWNKDSNATWYRLWIGRDGYGGFYSRWYEMSGTGEGVVTLRDHPSGDFTWWIQPWGPDGYGPWSGPTAFSTPSIDPAKAVLTSPSGTIDSSRPTFSWQTAARTSWYRVWVQRGGSKVFDHWTQNTSLSSLTTLLPGVHYWWVGTWNSEAGKTVWSDRMDFRVP